MTAVSDLIQGATFSFGDGFNELAPEISIILPTFRRGDNGLFKECVKSLLRQDFKNFELIIVDDASTDSTLTQIQEFIKEDSRVSSIRHAKNVGLPAISCNEAFLKSRANKIFFAFDDNLYEESALAELWRYQKNNPDALITYATTNLVLNDGKYSVLLGNEDFDFDKILTSNYIPNSPMMVDKRVLNDVGLYDPHVCITRVCDWDLWIRAAKRYPFSRVDKVLSTEKGLSQNDSIGNSYILDSSLVKEWMSQDRNLLLSPANFLNYDVSSKPSSISHHSKQKIDALLIERFPNLSREQSTQSSSYALLIISSLNTSVEFYFGNLSEELKKRVIILHYDGIRIFNYLDLILGSSFVIFASDLTTQTYAISDLLKSLKIPYYYFSDDDSFQFRSKIVNKNSKSFLRNACGALLTTKGLIDFFSKNNLQKNLIHFPNLTGSDCFIRNQNDFSYCKEINDAAMKYLFEAHPKLSILDFYKKINSIVTFKTGIYIEKPNLKNLIKVLQGTIKYYCKKKKHPKKRRLREGNITF